MEFTHDVLSLSAELRVDAVCQRYESEWKAGRRPQLEEFLVTVSGAERIALLRELLLLELGYRRRVGENPREEEYLERFPEATAALMTALFVTPNESTEAKEIVIAGRYTLVQKIGEGGMGEIWVAKQTDPVRRKVAIKLIKAGMDSRAVVARFEQERQALALMDHPNIAKVLDAGLTEDRRPFFVMELVNGLPLNKFCDEARLTPRQRLELFVPICQAVQHAHQKGVVHRDLKPSNILITLIDGQPIPKVIDFGLAKALAGKLTDESLSTQFGAVVGTLEYMSPEQAGYSGADIDTRADVYSLGVLLYELLTGLRPIDAKRLKTAAFAEMIQIIQKEEPSKPSTRLSTNQSHHSLAALRQTDPRKLTALLRGELDCVVMKCLEKQRDRRYETVSSLARDIQCYLAHEPVSARPPSGGYLARKFVRRHRGSVVAACLILLALVGGVIGTTAGLIRAETAWAAEADQRRQAVAREAESAAVLKFLEEHVIAAGRPKGHDGGIGYDVKLIDALRAAMPTIKTSFATQPLIEARVRSSLGLSFYILGDSATGERQYSEARDLYTAQLGPDHPDTIASAAGLADCYRGLRRLSDAVALDEECLERRRRVLGPVHRDTLQSMHNLAIGYHHIGRSPEALTLREQTLALRKTHLGPDHPDTLISMTALAWSYGGLNRLQEALMLNEEVLAIRLARHGRDHYLTIDSLFRVANVFSALGRYQEAVKIHEEVLQWRKQHLDADNVDTLQVQWGLSRDYAALGRMTDAIKLSEETLTIRLKILGPDHQQTLLSMGTLALQYMAVGRYEDALKLNAEILKRRHKSLNRNHPQTLLVMWRYADSLLHLKRGEEAIPILDDCLRLSIGQSVNVRLRPAVIDLRLRYYAEKNDAAGCQATAEIWENLKLTDMESLYQAAGLRAVTSAQFAALGQVVEAKANGDRSIAWMATAVANGFRDYGRLEKDADFISLRENDKFNILLDSIKSLQVNPSEPTKQ